MYTAVIAVCRVTFVADLIDVMVSVVVHVRDGMQSTPNGPLHHFQA